MSISDTTIRRGLTTGSPVIDGNEVTFIWQGKSAPQLTGDMTHWSEQHIPFKRISPKLIPESAEPVWACTLSLPRDVYVEYAFYDAATQSNFLDPLNKKSVNNGVGGRNNYFYMPETMPSPFPMRRADVTPGTLSKYSVETGILDEFGTRDIYLYKPQAAHAVPLLVVYDGVDYIQRGKLAVIVDNLIADHRIQPIAMAFLQNGKRRRAVEYICSDATIAWLDHEVLPLAREYLKLLDINENPSAYGILGASFGGLMSLYTGLRMPEIFGKVLAQSGVYHFEGRDLSVVDLVRHEHAPNMDLWMDVGELEFLLEDNRRMKGILSEHGYSFIYREYKGGHNYTAWRNDVWHGLEKLFPPETV